MDLIDRVREITVKYSREDDRILAVFLIGSSVGKTRRPDSDVDLAVMVSPGEKFDSMDRIKFGNEISYEIKQSVDIGEISSKNLVYAREALLKGIPMYQQDPEKMKLYRATLLGMYGEFQFDRREVLDAYRAR